MNPDTVATILERILNLPPEQRVVLADEVDRLTWSDRMQILADRIQARARQCSPPTDGEIDQLVDEVRSETPLYERYWVRRRRSAP